MDERVYRDMRAEILHNQKNREEMSLEELLCGGMCDPIGVDVSTTHTTNTGYAFTGVKTMIVRPFCLAFSS